MLSRVTEASATASALSVAQTQVPSASLQLFSVDGVDYPATLIVTGTTREDADTRCGRVLRRLQDRFNIETIVDRNPMEIS